jgi:Tfp pilus assembly protein PilV
VAVSGAELQGDAGREAGESLLELLVAVVILGVAVVAIVGGLGVSVLMSDVHRKQTDAGAAARSYAEALQAGVAASPTQYNCAGTYAVPAGVSVPATVGPPSLSVKWWAPATKTWTAGSCGTDVGVQQVTVEVATIDARAAERVVVVVRRPCRPSESWCS